MFIISFNDADITVAWNMAYKMQPGGSKPPDNIYELAFQLVNNKRGFKVDTVMLQDLMTCKPDQRPFDKMMAKLSITCMNLR